MELLHFNLLFLLVLQILSTISFQNARRKIIMPTKRCKITIVEKNKKIISITFSL